MVQRNSQLANQIKTIAVALVVGGVLSTNLPGLSLSLGNGNFAQLMRVGRDEVAQKAYSQAAATFKKAVEAKPDSWEAHLELGKALSRIGSADAAILELLESLRFNLKNPEAREEMAVIFMNRSSFDEAGGQLKQVLDLVPDDYMARGNYGLCLEQIGYIDAAIEQFNIVAKAKPNNIEALYNLALAYQLKGKFDEAALYYKRVLAIDPKHSLSYMGLGKSYLFHKDYKTAVLLEQQAIKMAPTNHFAYLVLGDAYDGMGATGESLEAYRKAIQLNPKDPGCRAVLANLLKQKMAAAGNVSTR